MAFENGVHWRPLEPHSRGKHATFNSALDAALSDLMTERNAFFDTLPDSWRRLFPLLPLRPGRYDNGCIVLYVSKPAILYAMRPKLAMIKDKLSALQGAPKQIKLRLEIHS